MNKKNLILDLDQTLLSSENPMILRKKKYEDKYKKFNYKNMDNIYIVFERPHLQEFLDYVFKNFNVSIWTAASTYYALFIIDKIIIGDKKDRKLDWIFTSYHTKISKRKTGTSKNLNMLKDYYAFNNYNKYNTIIIDDNCEVFDTQPLNCIKAVPFEFKKKNSENDIFLKKLIIVLDNKK